MASINGISEPKGGWKQGEWYQARQYWGGTLSQPGQINSLSDQQGAGQQVSKEVVNQTNPNNYSYIQQGAGGKVISESEALAKGWDINNLPGGYVRQPQTKEQVTPYLNNLGQQLFQNKENPKVRTPTMDEIKKQVTPSQGLPSLLNRTDERAKLRENLGVADLEQGLTDIKSQVDAEMANMRKQRGIEEGKPVPMNVIQGRISKEERAAQERIDVLGREQSRLTNELNTKYTIIGQQMQDMGLDYNDAVKRYDQEFNTNMNMYKLILGQEDKALTQENRDRTSALANLQIYTNAITKGNLNYSSMGADQKLMIRKLEIQSGLPVGFMSSLQMNPKDRILSINSKTGEALTIGQDGKFKVLQTGMRTTGSSSGGMSYTPKQTQVKVADAIKILKKIDAGYQTIGGKLKETPKYTTNEYGERTQITSRGDRKLSSQESDLALQQIIDSVGGNVALGEKLFKQAIKGGNYHAWKP